MGHATNRTRMRRHNRISLYRRSSNWAPRHSDHRCSPIWLISSSAIDSINVHLIDVQLAIINISSPFDKSVSNSTGEYVAPTPSSSRKTAVWKELRRPSRIQCRLQRGTHHFSVSARRQAYRLIAKNTWPSCPNTEAAALCTVCQTRRQKKKQKRNNQSYWYSNISPCQVNFIITCDRPLTSVQHLLMCTAH